MRAAVLIACKNGEATIASTVRSAATQADVYVLSDGSTDQTAEVAAAAGATVIARTVSGGKPDALRALMRQHDLAARYDYIAVLDDDTIVSDDYIARLVEVLDRDGRVAVARGRIDSRWERDQRWNPYIAMRAFMYWSYQATVKRGQNALHLVNVICGANSLFRAEIFAALVEQDAPYAIDDMFWLAEIARRRLGRVAYVHAARSWTIDPHTFRDWYRQTVRWSWGQFQSVRGHKLGSFIRRDRSRGRFAIRFSWFDLGYLALLVDWLPYMLEPFVFAPAAYFFRRWVDPMWFVGAYLVTSVGWIMLAAAALRRPRLLVLAPAILVLDLIYRVTMLHALWKTIRQPSVEVCRWDSPERFVIDGSAVSASTH
jgi:cellulose synthase/poly-beta-1,6-N-acetylglucosamine synthase-like glycosyltransferase